ncbi:hypothetical protein ACU4GA_27125 [Methylobacterium oryzae CBMB20]
MKISSFNLKQKGIEMQNQSSALLDNAFVHGAANISVNTNGIRAINVIGLSAFVDAIVMHQRLTVSKSAWEYFESRAPIEWVTSIEPIIDIVELELPPATPIIKSALGNSNALLACYKDFGFDVTKLTSPGGYSLNQIYMSYKASSIAPASENTELWRSIWEQTDLSHAGIAYNLRGPEHVDTLSCLVRALQYEQLALDRGETYVAHELRGRILNFFSRRDASPIYRKYWDGIMKKMAVKMERECNERLNWMEGQAQPSKNFWAQLKLPIFLLAALQRSNNYKDLFYHVIDLRHKALPLRQALINLSDAQTSQDCRSSIAEAREISNYLATTSNIDKNTVISVAIGFPLSVSLSIDIPISGNSRSTRFLRDINDNYHIPFTLCSDIARVFRGFLVSDLLLNEEMGNFHPNNISRNIGKSLARKTADDLLRDLDKDDY